MTITIKKEHVFKFLICLGALLGFVALFCFCGTALEFKSDGYTLKSNLSMFDYMFATNDAFCSCAGLIVLFVFELIALIAGIVLVTLMFMNKLDKKKLTIFIVSLAALLLVCAILSFCSKAFIYNGFVAEIKRLFPGEDVKEGLIEVKEYFKYAHISSGPTAYGVLTLIGSISLGVSALILNLKD